jgi:GNAT superfamily N-acetyltransferase
MHIEPYNTHHLPELQRLVNHHLSVMIPGWSLPASYIEQHLQRNPHQPIIDPWVAERKTLLAIEKRRVVAAAHLLRYGTEDDVGKDYKGVGDIAWLLAWGENLDEAAGLLNAAHEQMDTWKATQIFAWDSHLPATLSMGIAEVWPHLIQLFTQNGYAPHRSEALYGGWLRDIPAPTSPPLEGLTFKRSVGQIWGVNFVAHIGDEEIGFCECVPDLTEGGALPSLRGWAELGNLWIDDVWRGHGIGTWLVRHAVEWLRLAGCDRIVLACDQDDEAAGAGRFYRRFGWDVFTRIHDGWSRTPPAP